MGKFLYGVTTAMVTPFDEAGNVNLEQVKSLTEFLISKGVHCLYPLGTTGEMMKLTVEERKSVADIVVKTANHRVTVYIHVGAIRQEDTIELAKHAEQIGADGIGVVTPVFFGTTERELEEYFATIASSVPNMPVYLYNIPQLSSNDLSVKVAQRIVARCKNVVGIKYSYADLIRTSEYLSINDGKFSVVHGTDRLFLPALAMGCSGTVSGVSCAFPEPFVAIYEAYQKNDLEQARQLQRVANQYCEVLRSGSNIAYFKEALRMRDIDVGHMKRPHLDLLQDEVAELREKLQEINSYPLD